MGNRWIREAMALFCGVMLLALMIAGDDRATVEAAGQYAAPGGRELCVLMYHSILDDENKTGKYVITPGELEADLRWLKENGYTTVGIDDLLAHCRGTAALPERPVMLTFDDGYYNNYSYVFPLLKKYEAKAVISIIGVYTDIYSSGSEKLNNNYSHLTWDQLEEMCESGLVEIGNHTYDMHGEKTRMGVKRRYGESDAEYKASIVNDITKLQGELEQRLGRGAICFAYPFGFINAEAEALIDEMGFLVTLSCYEHNNTISQDMSCLKKLGRFNRAHGRSAEKILSLDS